MHHKLKWFVFICLLSGSLYSAESLVPGSKEVGTKEDTKLITSIALWYMEIRNTVRDAYNTIQYTKAMINNLDNMKDWYDRNTRAWSEIGNKMHRLVSNPARWDEKLLEVEAIFDAIDYQVFEETSELDYILYSQDKYLSGAINSSQSLMGINNPGAEDYLNDLKMLYTNDENEIFISPDLRKEMEAAQAFSNFEESRRRSRKKMVSKWQKGKLVDATLINTSLALSKISAIKRMQKKRIKNYIKHLEKLSDVDGSNGLALKECLTILFDTNNELDYATLQLTEMELYFHQLGMAIYDASDAQGASMQAVSNFNTLYNYLMPNRTELELVGDDVFSSSTILF